MKIDIASYSNNGGHNFNEDSYGIGSNVFVVADGLGSHSNSKQASSCLVDYVLENTDGNFVLSDEQLSSHLIRANKAVIDMKNLNGFSESVTTAAVAWTGGGYFRCANVGDSRVYFFRNGRILQQTKDHSVCQAAVEMGQMEFSDIRQSSDRSKLLKVIGESDNLKLPKLLPPVEIQDDDAFLICSDGFWDFVYEEEMELDFHKSSDASEWLSYMLRRQLARAKNMDDNYTVICGIIHSDKKTAAAPYPTTAEIKEPDNIPDTVRIPKTASAPVPETALTAVPEKKSAMKIALIIVSLVAVIAIVLLVATLIKKDDSGENPEETTSATVGTEVGETEASDSDAVGTEDASVTDGSEIVDIGTGEESETEAIGKTPDESGASETESSETEIIGSEESEVSSDTDVSDESTAESGSDEETPAPDDESGNGLPEINWGDGDGDFPIKTIEADVGEA